jgi:hypothetical protein
VRSIWGILYFGFVEWPTCMQVGYPRLQWFWYWNTGEIILCVQIQCVKLQIMSILPISDNNLSTNDCKCLS